MFFFFNYKKKLNYKMIVVSVTVNIYLFTKQKNDYNYLHFIALKYHV